jgi:phosphoadenosine phosphosulfate reductase
MSDVFRNSRFEPDTRPTLADDAALPAGPFFVTFARFLAERETLLARGADLGVVLEPADRIETIGDDLARVGALAVRFPKFGDGRGYSTARLARERYAFKGELRAIGDVLWDQLEAYGRCGFDTLVIVDGPTRRRLEAGGRPIVPIHYQPAGDRPATSLPGRPWAHAVR